MNIKIIKIKEVELNQYNITFQYKTDFNQLVIKTINNLIVNNRYELKNQLVDLIPTYHNK